MKMKDIDWVAYVLTTIGALNWGLIGVGGSELNLIQTILGTSPALVQLVYIAIGLSGMYWMYKMTTMKR